MSIYSIKHNRHGEILLEAQTEIHAAYRAAELWKEPYRGVLPDMEISEIKERKIVGDGGASTDKKAIAIKTLEQDCMRR